MSEKNRHVMGYPIVLGQEVDCDKARYTEDAVHVRIGGIWVELRPPKWSTPPTSEKE